MCVTTSMLVNNRKRAALERIKMKTVSQSLSSRQRIKMMNGAEMEGGRSRL